MADMKTAEQISIKVKSLKYFTNLIKEVDKKGRGVIKLNCTGASFPFEKGDVLYLKVKTKIAELSEEIATMQIVTNPTTQPTETAVRRRRIPAPIGAAPTTDKTEERRAKNREACRKYQQKLRELGVKRLSDLNPQ